MLCPEGLNAFYGSSSVVLCASSQRDGDFGMSIFSDEICVR